MISQFKDVLVLSLPTPMTGSWELGELSVS